jgi:endonuclease YncB( thermonuclease family)
MRIAGRKKYVELVKIYLNLQIIETMDTNRFFLFFILSFFIVGNVYAKNCKKGKPCGNTCIARNKECHVGTSSNYSSPSYSSPTYSSPKRSRRKRSRKSYTRTVSYTSPNRSYPSDTSEDQEPEKKSPITIRMKVSGILDSDIFETNNKKRKKVILYGIDAPEQDQPFGQEAREFLKESICKKKIKTKLYDKNDDNIDTAIVFVGGKNINELMVKSGYAWVYQPSCTESFCDDWIKYEEEAREQKKGLWSNSSRIAPWIWR